MVKVSVFFLVLMFARLSSADLILFNFERSSSFITGANATGVVDTVANTFTIMNFSSTNGSIYEIPNQTIVFNAWVGINEFSLAPWDIDDHATGSSIIAAINSGPYAFIASKTNAQIDWQSIPGGDGQIAWGAYANTYESYFNDSVASEWYGWHDMGSFNTIHWSTVSYGPNFNLTSVPESSTFFMVGLALMYLVFYRRRGKNS